MTGVRSRLLDVLRQQPGESTIADLAEAAGLHRNTVSRHMQLLVDEGVVQRRTDSGGRAGRPRVLFSPAISTDQREFGALLSVVARALPDDHRARRELGRRWAREVRRRDGHERRPAVAVLADMGFDPAHHDDRSLTLHHCPLLADSAVDDAICTVHAAMVEQLFQDEGRGDGFTLTPMAEEGPCRIQVADKGL